MLQAICKGHGECSTQMISHKSATVPLLGLTAGLVVLTALFSMWTATSAWAFPQFLLALLLIVYCPGRLVLDSAPIRLEPLEHLTMSFLLGLMASSFFYWLGMYFGVQALFPALIAASLILCLIRAGRNWQALRQWQPRSDRAHMWLVGLILLTWATLAAMPLYYSNMVMRNGELAYLAQPYDISLHISIASELTHAVPPELPFAAGWPLSYHYAMDLTAALFNRYAGLSLLDLTVRFLPTFFFTLTVLAVFCFSRSWLGSGRGAVLVALLVVLGEDFSFIPGLLQRPESWWAFCFFGAPSTFSLYWLNPMLPALGILFGGLFCLRGYFRDGGKTWLLLTAVLFAGAVEYKVFVAAHLLLALGIAGLVCLACARDVRLLRLAAVTALMVLPLIVPMILANAAGGKQAVVFRHDYIPLALKELHLAQAPWAKSVLNVLDGSRVTADGIAALLLIAVPGYLLGVMGSRVIAARVLVRALCRPIAAAAPRFFLGVFVIVGVTISLTCAVIDTSARRDMQYNNAIWFLVQSKYVLWVFAVETLLAFCRQRGFVQKALAVGAVVGLALPSTVQLFQFTVASRAASLDPRKLNRQELEVIAWLQQFAGSGDVILMRKEAGLPITAVTQCHLPVTETILMEPFMAVDELKRRKEDRDEFWKGWSQGMLRAEILTRYKVHYVIVDRRPGESDPGYWLSAALYADTANRDLQVQPCFENSAFTVYKIQRVHLE